MSKSPSADSSAAADTTDPRITGTPARPALKRRSRLFALMFVLYAAWMAALIAMSIQLHRDH